MKEELGDERGAANTYLNLETDGPGIRFDNALLYYSRFQAIQKN